MSSSRFARHFTHDEQWATSVVSRCNIITQGGSYEETTDSHSHDWSHGAERRLGPHERQRRSRRAHQEWDHAHPELGPEPAGASRFTTVFTGAVRDNNTGLVWEQAPDATGRLWTDATHYCVNQAVGGTVGWRLPSLVELKSMQDPSQPAPFVPANAFTISTDSTPGVHSATYWSAAVNADNSLSAWVVQFFFNGFVNNFDKSFPGLAWCVRGGMNADQY
jgi:hypothetical protein